MKKIIPVLVFTLIVSTLQAQLNMERAVFTTGGSFQAPGNTVKVYTFETGEEQLDVIEEIPGDFSNDVTVDGRFAYAHIGRGFANPLTDAVYKVDLITGEATDSLTNIPGTNNLFVYEDLLMVGKGFAATGSNLVFFDKNALDAAPVYEAEEITAAVGGHLLIDEKLYVSYTAADTGRVAIYDMSGTLPVYESEITLDTLSKGIGDMIFDGEFIYATNTFFAFDADFNLSYFFGGLTRIDPSDGTFDTGSLPSADNPLVVAPNPIAGGNVVIGDFGAAGNFVDATTLMPLNFNILPGFTDGIADAANQYLWVQVTDYSSFGEIRAFDNTGAEVYNLETDISGSAIDLAYNLSPTAEDDVFQGAFVTTDYDVLENDSDPEGEPLSILSVQSVNGGTVTINDDNTVEATFDDESAQITFEYTAADIWGRATFANVVIDNFTATENPFTPAAVNIFPNPATQILTVDVTAFAGEETEITVKDLTGKNVLRQTENTSAATVDVSVLQAGIYLLEVTSASKRGSVKVVKL